MPSRTPFGPAPWRAWPAGANGRRTAGLRGTNGASPLPPRSLAHEVAVIYREHPERQRGANGTFILAHSA